MLGAILPTYQVERNWPGEQTSMFGAEGVTGQGMTADGHLAISLHNTSDLLPREEQLELLVWRFNADLFIFTDQSRFGGSPLHIFTPLQDYNPTEVLGSGPPIFFPWLQPVSPGESAHLSRAGHLDAGQNPSLMVVTVNGVPTTAIGPALVNRGQVAVAGGFAFGLNGGNAYEFGLPGIDTPPMIVRPGQKLTVQSVVQFLAPNSLQLRANFWWSERKWVVGL